MTLSQYIDNIIYGIKDFICFSKVNITLYLKKAKQYCGKRNEINDNQPQTEVRIQTLKYDDCHL